MYIAAIIAVWLLTAILSTFVYEKLELSSSISWRYIELTHVIIATCVTFLLVYFNVI